MSKDTLDKSTPEYDELEIFHTKLDVWQYLKDEGWAIGRSQFYQHCKDGLLRPDKATGQYLLSSVEKYAKLHLKLKATGSKINDRLEQMQERKLKLELEQAETRLERERHELGVKRKKFIPRDEHELAIVGRAVAMLAHLKHMVQVEAVEYIDLVQGDQKFAPDLVAQLNEDIEQRLAVFASDVEFDVIFEAD